MILSHRKKFIFIHNYKVTGASISKSLHLYKIVHIFWSSDMIKFLTGNFPRMYANHIQIS
jgi:hypothetical protein